MFRACSSLTTLVCGTGDFIEGVIDLSGYVATSYSGAEFYFCTRIATVKLPASVPLSTNMFYGCGNLSTLHFIGGNSAPSWGMAVFWGLPKVGTLYYPSGATGFIKGIFGGALDSWTFTDGTAVEPASISLNAALKSIKVTETFTLTVTVLPANATSKTVTWSSSNTKAATVSGGKVTAVSAGTATITAKTANNITATCTVIVTAPTLILNTATRTVSVGKTFTLTATVIPPSAKNGNITWKSGNTTIATVTAAGMVKGVKAGNTVVTATVPLKGGGTATAKCTIYVGPMVTNVALPATAKISTTSGATLTPTVAPANAAFKKLTWASSDTNVVTVTAAGALTGKKAGTATITAAAADGSGKKATCKVTVGPAVTGVTLNRAAVPLHMGKTLTLTAMVTPANAAAKAVTWSSNSTAVAKVSATGVVTGIKAGTAVITVKTADGAKTASCKVTVGHR